MHIYKTLSFLKLAKSKKDVLKDTRDGDSKHYLDNEFVDKIRGEESGRAQQNRDKLFDDQWVKVLRKQKIKEKKSPVLAFVVIVKEK